MRIDWQEEKLGKEIFQAIPFKIIGVGDLGCTVVDSLCAEGFYPDHCLMIGLEPWRESRCPVIINLYKHNPPRGLHFGHDPAWCLEAINNAKKKICRTLEGSSLNVIVAGIGGVMEISVCPFIADISRELVALTIAVISSPFSFEGNSRMKMARMGLEKMQSRADMTIQIPYERLEKTLRSELTIVAVFQYASKLLGKAVKDVCRFMLTKQDYFGGDFETKKIFLQKAGIAYMGFGEGDIIMEAMVNSISSPLLGEDTLQKAGLVFANIHGRSNVTFEEVSETLTILQNKVSKDTSLGYELFINEEIGVSLIATKIRNKNQE